MRKSIFLFVVFVGFSVHAQQFYGKAEYYSKYMFKNGTGSVGVEEDTDPELKEAYEVALKKASENRFTLTFNRNEALYEKQQSLEKPTTNKGVSVTISISGEGKKYINIRDKTKICEDDILGKEFLIVEKLEPLNWSLGNETKKIGEYTCYKAELIIPVSDKEKAAYQAYLKKQETKISFFPMEEPKEKKITAWYTPDIPVSVGPSTYWGLPGLILEIDEEEMIILCSKITLSNKENPIIKVPNKGTEVTQDEFDTIHKEKMDSLEER